MNSNTSLAEATNMRVSSHQNTEEVMWNPLIVSVILYMEHLALLGLECDVAWQISSELEGDAREIH